MEYQGKPCLAALRMPSNAGVCYLGELPELATAPVPLEELPGSEITSLINLGENAVCLCASQQWLVLNTKTGKHLLRGFREEGRPEPIAVGGKLYEFDPNTVTFTLLLDISQP